MKESETNLDLKRTLVILVKEWQLKWNGHVKGWEKKGKQSKFLKCKWKEDFHVVDPQKLHSLYRSPNIARVIKSRRFRWEGHVARLDEGRNALKF